jgi:hypothetical protein
MTRLKRLVRPGLLLSAVLHGGLLGGALLAGMMARVQPPEAVTVEIVPSDEVPQLDTQHVEGTPLDSTSTGSEMSSDSKTGSAEAAQPRPKLNLPSPQQLQAQASSKDSEKPTAAPLADGETPPMPQDALVPPATPRIQRQSLADRASAPPPALSGARISGGLDAPATNPAMLPHDDTALFRARLGSCSRLPDWFNMNDSVVIVLRVSLKRDGTLASPPQLLRSPLSADAVALTSTAVNALERCQPFTELPADKYKDWKTLDLVISPLSLSGR